MARLDRDPSAQGPLVQGFRDGGFSVDGVVHRAVFLTPVAAWAWTAPPIGEIAPEDLEPILVLDPAPEFVLLGTGATIVFPPRAFVRALEERGIGVEVMDSRAAARTWGMLRSEERWIAAALMPLGSSPL
ncbi:Mth938-like domain-containing protein [Sphingosinicella sp. BN140058]|uniref:Mth938-like domain-containing protein n=1 Tax=Sphingosinicella sp. BN140058 TaxID=1892855 RepID=UPI001FB11520|nr:Mth938-like domain-containing protein [Sphingosinicella sp. BN140058]